MARVPYLTKEQLPADRQELYQQIAGPRGGHVPKVFGLFLNSPDFAGKIADVGTHARNATKVPPDAREIAILAAMREIGCQYEFTHHMPMAQQAGVRDVVVEGLKAKSTKGMIPKESVFVDFARQVVNRRVNGPTFEAIEHLLGRQGAVDLTMLIGYYLMIGHVMLALGVELEADVPPLMPEG